MAKQNATERVLVLLGEGFEEIEALAPVDLLRRAGVEVVTGATGESRSVRGRSGIVVQADELLDELDAGDFTMLVVPGGPGVGGLRSDGRAASLASHFAAQGKPVAAICAAPLVLADAGLLEGRRYTAHFSTAERLPDALSGEAVVEDDGIITSRGAGTSIEFGLALVAKLRGPAVAAEVARAIMR